MVRSQSSDVSLLAKEYARMCSVRQGIGSPFTFLLPPTERTPAYNIYQLPSSDCLRVSIVFHGLVPWSIGAPI